jgi:hypothetical protein
MLLWQERALAEKSEMNLTIRRQATDKSVSVGRSEKGILGVLEDYLRFLLDIADLVHLRSPDLKSLAPEPL